MFIKLLVLVFSVFSNYSVTARMDLYVPDDQVLPLFGIENAQLYYIREGKVNQNALKFVAHVQPEQNILKYIWKTISPEAVIFYDVNISESKPMYEPSDSIAGGMQKLISNLTTSLGESGRVPQSPISFYVYAVCSGLRTGNVTFTTTIRMKYSEENTTQTMSVKIHRLKKCKQTYSLPGEVPVDEFTTPQTDSIYPDPNIVDRSGHGVPQSTAAFYISILVVSLIIFLIVVVIFIWHRRLSKRARMNRSIPMGTHHVNQCLQPALPNNEQKPPSNVTSLMQITPYINDLGTDISDIQIKLGDIAIERSDVVLKKLILKGTFARIYKGHLEDGTLVLVKTVSGVALECTDEQKRLLLFESSLLRGMHHMNLLPIKHVVFNTPNSPPMVIFAYMEGGNLKHYLQGIKAHELPGLITGILPTNQHKFEQVATPDLVGMAIQIACGMTYLSKRGLVHKDLASRNCVLDNDMKIKITDNALSRDLFPGDYCCLGDNENRPLRWLALESLVHKVYSSASDMWSFGVLLWELQSLAATPYTDIDDFEMADYLSDGFRLSQPINCPDHLYSIMAGCWHYSADQRPSFSQLLQCLTEFYAELGDYV